MLTVMSFAHQLSSISAIYYFVIPGYVVNAIQLPLVLLTTIRSETTENPQVVKVPFRLHLFDGDEPPPLPAVNVIPPTPSVLTSDHPSSYSGAQMRQHNRSIFSESTFAFPGSVLSSKGIDI